MKNIFKIAMAIVTLGLIIVSCNKETTTTDQAIVSQTTHELGALLLPPEVYAQIPVAETPKVDLRLRAFAYINTPTVGDQGGEGSCVAWGTTYAGRSETYYQGLNWSYGSNIFSPEYVYNQIKAKGNCGAGAYVYKALDLLKSQGVCTWSTMPYTDVSCKTLPNATQKAEAAKYTISSYATVKINTDIIKAQLSSGKPVIVAGPVDRAFMFLANGAVLGNRSGNLGGHCYCLVGYDDGKGTGAFKFQNSWGPGWASGGFGWISYSSISTWWTEAYVLYN